MTRMLLEHSYEAIIDAGINPKQLRGKNTAVIIGASYLESQMSLYKNLQVTLIKKNSNRNDCILIIKFLIYMHIYMQICYCL